MDYDYQGPRAEGDRALYDLLMLDNVAQNGGLLHGVGVLDQTELAAAVAGYRWFGLDARAGAIESVAAEASRIDPEDPDSLPAAAVLEERADDLYFGEQGGDLIGPHSSRSWPKTRTPSRIPLQSARNRTVRGTPVTKHWGFWCNYPRLDRQE